MRAQGSRSAFNRNPSPLSISLSPPLSSQGNLYGFDLPSLLSMFSLPLLLQIPFLPFHLHRISFSSLKQLTFLLLLLFNQVKLFLKYPFQRFPLKYWAFFHQIVLLSPTPLPFYTLRSFKHREGASDKDSGWSRNKLSLLFIIIDSIIVQNRNCV